LNRPEGEAKVTVPAKGAKLRVGDIDKLTDDQRTQKALKRLAEDKAPQTVAQLVMWNVSAGITWDQVAEQSRDWANDHERALARQFVDRLDEPRDPINATSTAAPADSGRFFWTLTAQGESARALAGEMSALLEKQTFLGLKATKDVPPNPSGPALACRAEIDDAKISVQVTTTDPQGSKWVEVGSFVLKRPATSTTTKDELTRQAAVMADSLAGEVLSRLVHVQLSKPKRGQSKLVYQVKVENDSPLILNGLALAGPDDSTKEEPKALAGICLPPHKSLTLPASAELVNRLNLKDGMRVVAADLSGL